MHTHRGSVSTLIAQPLPKTCCNEQCYSGPWGMTAQPAAGFPTQSAPALWGCEDGWLQHCPVVHICAGKRKCQISSFSDNMKECTLRGTEQQPRSQYFLKKELQSVIIFSSKYLLPNIVIHTCDPPILRRQAGGTRIKVKPEVHSENPSQNIKGWSISPAVDWALASSSVDPLLSDSH